MSLYLLNRGTVPLGAGIVGVLAGQLGAEAAIRVMALIGLGIVAFAVATNPAMLKLKVALRSEEEEDELRLAAEAEAGVGDEVAASAGHP